MKKMIAFRLWGDYAHFKKYYTTTSPLTFEVPPPPTLIGIISAIIGLGKKEYLNYFQDENVYGLAIVLNRPVQKVRWTINLIDTKRHFWKIQNRTQIRTEYLKSPDYNIYFWHQEKSIYVNLLKNLRLHQSVYSVALGLSELLGNFQFVGETEAWQKTTSEAVEIHSVFPFSLIKENSLSFEVGKEIFEVNYPLHMLPNREVDRRDHLIFERNGRSIRCIPKVYWQTREGNNIVFL